MIPPDQHSVPLKNVPQDHMGLAAKPKKAKKWPPWPPKAFKLMIVLNNTEFTEWRQAAAMWPPWLPNSRQTRISGRHGGRVAAGWQPRKNC